LFGSAPTVRVVVVVGWAALARVAEALGWSAVMRVGVMGSLGGARWRARGGCGVAVAGGNGVVDDGLGCGDESAIRV
jgi:hypothetical protein